MSHNEAYVEKYLVQQVHATGGETRKVVWHGHVGAPDRLVMYPEAVMCFVECKAPGQKARRIQAVEHDKLRKLGFRVEVIDTREKVDELLKELKP